MTTPTLSEPIFERMRLLQADHAPEGWPAVQMRDITALCEEIAMLRSALDEAREDSLRWVTKLNNVHMSARAHRDEIDRLRDECARLRADAERYAFLRHDFSPMGLNIDGNHAWAYRRNATLKGPTLDDAIDAARAAMKGQP